jgi:hypothetical protein
MPKCLHPPCPRQVADALYCEEHQYVPQWTTNVTREQQPSWGYQPQSAPESAPRSAQPLWLIPIVLIVAILAILAVAVLVILKFIF